jgi:RimJ/RimL family protein N-acetyltransferase
MQSPLALATPPSLDASINPSFNPSLDTERLTLRVPRRDDFDDLVAMWADPVVTRYVLRRTLSREEVWARLLRAVGHWRLQGFGTWMVRERGTGVFVGEVGLIWFQRDLGERSAWFAEAPETAWVLTSGSHGKGYATEAVNALLPWARDVLGQPRLVCMIDPANTPSLNVAHKCGYEARGETTYQGEVVRLFERPLA